MQGGNTGLVGGGVPAGGEVLLSLARLVDARSRSTPLAAQVTVGAGVTLEALQRHARAAGLDFGVDLAARSPATVGGLVATNAGGIRVVRYGSMRAQVVGLEAVLADGTVLSAGWPAWRRTTPATTWPSCSCGSEGTLAVITRVRRAAGAAAPARGRSRWSRSAGTAAALDAARRGRGPALALAGRGGALLRRRAGAGARARRAAGAVRRRATRRTWCSSAPARTDPTDELLEVLGELRGRRRRDGRL